MAGGRFRELLKKYGKVALGVHFSVSAASIAGLYVAINNNVDVESILERVGMGGVDKKTEEDPQSIREPSEEFVLLEETTSGQQMKKNNSNRTSELVASSGGALALAFLCNKALFPIRVPITIAVTPPLARFLARRGIINKSV